MKKLVNYSIVRVVIIYILRTFMHFLHIFPMKENRVFFIAYQGMQYSDSPMYITEYILKHYPKEYEIIWAFQNPMDYKWLEKQGIIVINSKSLKRFYYEATAKASINNIGGFSWNPLRKTQHHINTWHSGIEITYCGINEKNNDWLMRYSIKLNAKNTTMMFASNTWFRDFAAKEQFAYDGLFWEKGLPRSDDLINSNYTTIRNRVRSELGIGTNTVVFMYAPTWRYGRAEAMPFFDYAKVRDALRLRFGDDVLVIKRSHHMTHDNINDNIEGVLDLTLYPRVEELIAICDILVSDYSSIIWDATLTKQYILLYAPDEEKFNEERGIYKPLSQWIYPVTYSMQELIEHIWKIDFEVGRRRAEDFSLQFGSLETGKSTELFVNWLQKQRK